MFSSPGDKRESVQPDDLKKKEKERYTALRLKSLGREGEEGRNKHYPRNSTEPGGRTLCLGTLPAGEWSHAEGRHAILRGGAPAKIKSRTHQHNAHSLGRGDDRNGDGEVALYLSRRRRHLKMESS